MKRTFPLALILVLVACGGPSVPLEVVGKNVAVDVAFGPNGALPPVGVHPVPGGYVIVPPTIPPEELPPIDVPPPPLPPKPCPGAHPLAIPKKEATDHVPAPPVGAAYRFRFSGERIAGSETTTLAPLGMRNVGNIGRSTGTDYPRYDVSEVAGVEVTISSYQITPDAIQLTRVQRIVNGQQSGFTPVPPITILPIPPRQTDPLGRRISSWRSAGTDVVSQTSMVVSGQLIEANGGKQRVDACGQLIDTWLAELSVETLSPTEDTDTLWRINVASQYGGLLVKESRTTTGTKDGAVYKESRTAIISEVPRG